MFTMRKGRLPQTVITTTPRLIPFLQALKARPTTHVTRGSTYDNSANLSPAFIESIVKPYEGTLHGRQELEAEDIEMAPGALWDPSVIDQNRWVEYREEELLRVVVGVDPKSGGPGTEGETGIIVAAKTLSEHGVTLGDYSTTGGPETWGPMVVEAFYRHRADAVVVEVNQGGAMVSSVLRATRGGLHLPIIEVWASRGKITRAEPVSQLMHQGRDHHVGSYPDLELQMVSYVPGMPSPDRLDAKVWAYTDLFFKGKEGVLSVGNHDMGGYRG
jgi:phage terminase large subunit-like protein